jgi:hypothetical protein
MPGHPCNIPSRNVRLNVVIALSPEENNSDPKVGKLILVCSL